MKKFYSAAEAGHPGAQAALGELYFQGKGTQRNAQEAAKVVQAGRQIKEMWMPKSRSDGCITPVRGFLKILMKPSSGFA